LPGSGGTVTFKYDPFGRRIYKSSSSGTSIYAYDEYKLIEETNSPIHPVQPSLAIRKASTSMSPWRCCAPRLQAFIR
jgi:hypothetical protein